METEPIDLWKIRNDLLIREKLDRLGCENKDRPYMLDREGKSVAQCRARITVMCDHVTVTN